MTRRRPFKLVTTKEAGETEEFLGYEARQLLDVLECGHKPPANIFPRPSRSPYVTKDGQTWRRCNSCPLEEVS